MSDENIQLLLKHIAACPIGWAHGRLLMPRNYTQEEAIAWLSKLDELAKLVGAS